MKIKPVGNNLIILPSENQNTKTEAGIEIIQNELSEGKIVEVSDELSELYKVDDVVLFDTGAGQSQYYNGKSCLWLRGAKNLNEVSDIRGIITA